MPGLPPRLWAAAVALVLEDGLYGTARALHLDYATLKRHVSGRGDQVRASGPSGFVELATTPPASACTLWLMEIEGGGDRARAPERPGADGSRRVHAAGRRGRCMIQITPQMRILIAVTPVDVRRGIDGMARLCREVLDSDPFAGWLFVFRNRWATAIKIVTSTRTTAVSS